MDEINSVSNLEIHFVDSSGVISWRFLSDQADFPFIDWNFSSTTQEDYSWLCKRIEADGFDIYFADFPEQGAYTCRILVPGMSEIYPVEDLEWENNSIGNQIRPALLNLSALKDTDLAALLADLQTLNLNDERPLWELLGLAIPVETAWKELRIGELKTLIALAIGDREAVLEGCDWIHHFKQMDPTRRLVYRCIENLIKLENTKNFERSLILLYGSEIVRQAKALLDKTDRFFDLEDLGPNMEISQMHQTLLSAYDKLFT